MSSLRNVVKRVTHKERAQPLSRAKLGLLEKKKDYKERSNDYKQKQKNLKSLREKAANRNVDEFYFNMHKSHMKNGHHKIIDDGKCLDMTLAKLLKTQDMGYLHMKKALEMSKIESLDSNLHQIGCHKPPNHKIFVDTKEDVNNFDLSKHFETTPELSGQPFNRIKTKTLQKLVESDDAGTTTSSKLNRNVIAKANRSKESAYKELNLRRKRLDKLDEATKALMLQRNLMGKGAKRKLVVPGKDGEDDQIVYKWKKRRQK